MARSIFNLERNPVYNSYQSKPLRSRRNLILLFKKDERYKSKNPSKRSRTCRCHVYRTWTGYCTIELLSLGQTVEEEKRALEEYLKDSEEDALKRIYQEGLLNIGETKLAYKKDQMKIRKESWENKA